MQALATNLWKGADLAAAKRKGNRAFQRLRLDNVRYKGKPTPDTWKRYDVY